MPSSHKNFAINAIDGCGEALLHRSAKNLNLEQVEWLLQMGDNPNAINDNGETVLIKTVLGVILHAGLASFENAMQQGIRIIHALAHYGADINATLRQGKATALHLAANQGLDAIVEALMHHGANIDAPDDYGNTPLIEACRGSRAPMMMVPTIHRLLKAGADPFNVDYNKNTPLQLWLMKAKAETERTTIKLFLEKGAPMNALDLHQQTPLFTACEYLDPEAVQLLLDAGADPNAQNKYGNTALHHLMSARHAHLSTKELIDQQMQIGEILVQRGADPKIFNHNEESPLFLAALKNKRHFVEWLLPLSHDLHVKNQQGKTMLDITQDNTIQQMLREEMVRRERKSLHSITNIASFSTAKKRL